MVRHGNDLRHFALKPMAGVSLVGDHRLIGGLMLA